MKSADGYDEWEKESIERARAEARYPSPNDAIERRAELRDSGMDEDQIDRAIGRDIHRREEKMAMARSKSGTGDPVPQARQDLRQDQQTRQERAAAWVQQQVNEGYGIMASRAEQLGQTQAPQQNTTNRPRQPRQS